MKSIKPLFYFLSAIAFSIALQSCGTKGETSENPIPREILPVRVADIKKTLWKQEVKGSGKFTTDDETILSFKSGGLVESILVKEGDFIKKGQLLATLNQSEISSAVNQAQLVYEKALRDHERVQRLLSDSVVTIEQAENAKTALDIANQQLDAVLFNQSFSEIRAVADGYVLKKFVNPGQIISSGSPVLQTNGAGNSDWKLKVGISDKEWAVIAEGDSAVIRSDALKGMEIPSRVMSKSKVADPYTGAFTIELEVKNETGKSIAAGMFGSATIFPSVEFYCWAVPYEALLDANAGKGFVFVSNNDSTVSKVEVTVGEINNNWVQITEGLEDFDKIVISGSAYLKDQSLISIVP